MPLSPEIALQGKPVQIDTPDITKTFLTLGQLKYLNAEAARTQVQAQAAQEAAAREQTKFAEKGAEGQLLSSLGTGAVQPGPPPGGSPPAPGPAPQAARAPMDWTSPEGQAQIRAINPHGAEETIGKLLEFKGKQLEQAKSKIAQVVGLVSATTDQPSLDLAHSLLRQQGIDSSTIPTQWTPDLPKYLGESGRNAQQRLEEAQKALEQQQNAQKLKTEQYAAETGRIAETKPIPAGTGYFQHPDGTWTPMAPQAATPPSAPGASGGTAPLRSPQWQQVHDSQSQKFESGSQDFKASTAAYNEVVPALKQETNTGDLVALRAFSKLSLPSQAVRGAGSNAPLGNLMELVEGEITRLATDKGATIAGPLRKKLLETAKVLHAQQIDTHVQFRNQVRAETSAQLGPAAALEVAPNRITTLGSGSGKTMSQETFATYLKAHPGVTTGRAVLDLADQGWTVRGGPQ